MSFSYRVDVPVSDRAVQADLANIEAWANREVVPLLKQLRDPSLNVIQGNHVIGNMDPLGSTTVRYNVALSTNLPISPGAVESSALYIRNEHGSTWDTEQRFAYAIYGEQDQYQHLAGGSWSKGIHQGWGDFHFVALMSFGDEVPIIDASNTSPIVITTSRRHAFGHGNNYQVTGVLGNTAANGENFGGSRVTGTRTIELYLDGVNPAVGNGVYAGGGQITCINSPVGYEAAIFGENFLLQYYPTAAQRAPLVNTIGRCDGSVGYLSSIQAGFMPGGGVMPGDLVPGVDVWESGLGRCKMFEALIENDQLFTGGCYIAADTPNRGFVAHKRQHFRDNTGPPLGSGIGGFAMMVLEEAYYNPQNNDGSATAAMPRWQLFNNADMRFDSLLSTGAITTRDAPAILQEGSYWDGAQSLAYGLRHEVDVTGAGTARYLMKFGRPSLETIRFIFQSDGVLDMQSGDIIGVDDITCAGATSVLDMQLGSILAIGDAQFRSSLQGLGATADGTTTITDSPPLILFGSYWDGAASQSWGVRQFFDVTATTPAGRLLFQFGTGAVTTRHVVTDVGDVEMWGDAATGGATTKDSPGLYLSGFYWNGAASVQYGARFYTDVTATTPASRVLLGFGQPRAEAEHFYFYSDGSLGINGTDFGSGAAVIFIANATTNPTTNPTGGGVLYVTGGALTYRGSGGTVTTIAPA